MVFSSFVAQTVRKTFNSKGGIVWRTHAYARPTRAQKRNTKARAPRELPCASLSLLRVPGRRPAGARSPHAAACAAAAPQEEVRLANEVTSVLRRAAGLQAAEQGAGAAPAAAAASRGGAGTAAAAGA